MNVMAQLIANETLISQIKIGSENFSITNKRVILENDPNSFFIGLSELRGAEIKEEKITFNKFSLPSSERLGIICMFIYLAIIYIYFSVELNSAYSGLFGILCTGIGIGIPATLVTIFLLNIIQKSTSYSEIKVTLKITKTDNSLWVNQFYDLAQRDKLNEVSNQINSSIYK